MIGRRHQPRPWALGGRSRLLAASALLLAVPTAGWADPLTPTALEVTEAAAADVPAPQDVRAVANGTNVDVEWSRPEGGELFRATLSADPTPGTGLVRWTSGTTVSFRGLDPDTTYYVRVRAVDGQQPVGPFSETVTVSTTPGGEEPAVPPAPINPVPRPNGTLFGANYTTNSRVDEGVYAGRAEVARVFFQQLDGARFSGNAAVREALADGVDTFVISWKETDLGAIRTFLAAIPNDLTVYTSFNHEPENDHGSPGSAAYNAWSAEYRRQWAQQAPVMRAEGFIPTNILMAYTLVKSSGRDVADWTPPAGTVDVFAFDAYYGKGKVPQALVQRMAQAARDAGVDRTGLGETGAPVSDSTRLANTVAMRAAILAAGSFEFATYWNSAEGGYDSRMNPAVADAWFGS